MKKIVTSVAIASVLLAGTSSVGAQAPDLSALGGTTTATTTDATATGATNTATATTASTENEVATIKIIPSMPNVEAGSTQPVEVIVLVETKTAKKLSDQDINLTASILNNDANTMGTFTVWEYSAADQYFKFSYVPGTAAGTAQLSVKATSKTNPSNEVTESTSIVVSAAANATTTTPTNASQSGTTTTITTTSATSTPTTVDTTDLIVEDVSDTTLTGAVEEPKGATTNTDAIKITKTEVLDLNRIKLTFDHKIALGDNPLDMLTIETVKDKKALEVSNITLGSDGKSIIILTKEPLAKEEYHVTVKTVVNGETMKAVTLANGITTVSGMSEILLAIMAAFGAVGVFFATQRKRAGK